MKKWIEFTLDDDMDPDLSSRVEAAFHNDNFVETVLHLHLLIEKALTTKISAKFTRPEIIIDGTWSFYHKMQLYIAMFDPEPEAVASLRGFNKLRNSIAHDFEDEAALIEACLPKSRWGDVPPLDRVRAEAGGLLLMYIGGFKGARRLDRIEGETDT
jgi:hypothetical protein